MEEIFELDHVSGNTFRVRQHPSTLPLDDSLFEDSLPNLVPGRARVIGRNGPVSVNVLFWNMPHFPPEERAAFIRASDLNAIGVGR